MDNHDRTNAKPGQFVRLHDLVEPDFPCCVDRPFGFRNVAMPRFVPDKSLWGGFLCILIALAYAIARVMLEK
jgi:hypothetical protein